MIITLLFALLIHGSLSEVERNVMDSRLKADLVCLMDDLSITDGEMFSLRDGVVYPGDRMPGDGTPENAASERYGMTATTRQLVDTMTKKLLHFEPMSDFMYSLCHDILAAVVEVVSGQRFSEYLNEHIFTMQVLNFGYCYDIIHPALQILTYDGLKK